MLRGSRSYHARRWARSDLVRASEKSAALSEPGHSEGRCPWLGLEDWTLTHLLAFALRLHHPNVGTCARRFCRKRSRLRLTFGRPTRSRAVSQRSISKLFSS